MSAVLAAIMLYDAGDNRVLPLDPLQRYFVCSHKLGILSFMHQRA